MISAFQSNAFQNDAFQIDVDVIVVPPTVEIEEVLGRPFTFERRKMLYSGGLPIFAKLR
jgi:hypothetical protein